MKPDLLNQMPYRRETHAWALNRRYQLPLIDSYPLLILFSQRESWNLSRSSPYSTDESPVSHYW
jgi:hypothetical protein